MSKKKVIGLCHLCGLKKELTFEHIPPQAANNSNPIFIQKYDHLLNVKSYIYGKRGRSNRGFGAYTLCKSCNSNTGCWYAKDYVEFVKQGVKTLEEERNNIGTIKINSQIEPHQFIMVKFDFQIKPLNIVKQILTMFLSLDNSPQKIVLNIANLQEFILDKDSKKFPKDVKVFMYCNRSIHKKMVGFTYGKSPGFEGLSMLSEMNFEPFGFVLGIGDVRPKIPYCDITSFMTFEYNEERRFKMDLPYLKVDSPLIGWYSK